MREWSRRSATGLSVLMALSVIGVGQVAVAQDDGFAIEPLLMPFPAGDGVVTSGYEDPDNDWHQSRGNKYSLDLCAGSDCTKGTTYEDQVLAPVDLVYVNPYDYNGIDGDPPDYHIFEVSRSGDDTLCMALGHFDLTARPDEDGVYRRGTVLGSLLPYGDRPHVHIGMWIVRDTICDDSDSAERHAVAFEGDYELDGQSFPATETHGDREDRVVTSTNGADTDPASSIDSGDTIPVAQWIEPAEGAEVGPKLTLAAWPTPALVNGSLFDDTTTARVDFHVLVDGAKFPACYADQADEAARWSCDVDLSGFDVEDGDVRLTFDVRRTDGSIATSPDGVRTVVYAAPVAAAWRAPAKGAKLQASRLRFAAELSGDRSDTDQVVFRARWDEKKPKKACVATKLAKKGIWSCSVDLWKLGASLGRLQLSFDVHDRDGAVTRAPAGTRNVRFASKPPRPTGASYGNVRSKVVTPGFADTNHVDRVSWKAPRGSATRYDIYRVRGACYAKRKGDPCIRQGLNLRDADVVHLGSVDGSKRSFLYRYTTGFEAFVEDATTGILVQAQNKHGYSKSAIAYSLPCPDWLRCPNR